MEYFIRQAVPTDLSAITMVFTEVAKDPAVSIATPAEMLARANTINDYLDASSDPDFLWHALILLVDNSVVGVCDILNTPLRRTRHVAELGIGILPEYRGMGLGRALMEHALGRMQNNGITKVRLFVMDGNKNAMSLYDSMGFVQTGVYREEISMDNGFIDLFVMEKGL